MTFEGTSRSIRKLRTKNGAKSTIKPNERNIDDKIDRSPRQTILECEPLLTHRDECRNLHAAAKHSDGKTEHENSCSGDNYAGNVCLSKNEAHKIREKEIEKGKKWQRYDTLEARNFFSRAEKLYVSLSFSFIPMCKLTKNRY